MNNLTIDQKMEYLRQALEMGAKLSISFHDARDQEEAEKIASTLSHSLNVPFKENSSGVFNWFKIDDLNNRLETSVFFDKEYMEEDVDLSGMESAS